jgi:hypothetical protein
LTIVTAFQERLAARFANAAVLARSQLRLELFIAHLGQSQRATHSAKLAFASVELAINLLGRRHDVGDDVKQRVLGAREMLRRALDPPSARLDLDKLNCHDYALVVV